MYALLSCLKVSFDVSRHQIHQRLMVGQGLVEKPLYLIGVEERLHLGLDALGRVHHHRGGVLLRSQRPDEAGSVHLRHVRVADDEVERAVLVHRFQGFDPVRCTQDLVSVTAKESAEGVDDEGFVIDQQNVGHCLVTILSFLESTQTYQNNIFLNYCQWFVFKVAFSLFSAILSPYDCDSRHYFGFNSGNY